MIVADAVVERFDSILTATTANSVGLICLRKIGLICFWSLLVSLPELFSCSGRQNHICAFIHNNVTKKENACISKSLFWPSWILVTRNDNADVDHVWGMTLKIRHPCIFQFWQVGVTICSILFHFIFQHIVCSSSSSSGPTVLWQSWRRPTEWCQKLRKKPKHKKNMKPPKTCALNSEACAFCSCNIWMCGVSLVWQFCIRACRHMLTHRQAKKCGLLHTKVWVSSHDSCRIAGKQNIADSAVRMSAMLAHVTFLYQTNVTRATPTIQSQTCHHWWVQFPFQFKISLTGNLLHTWKCHHWKCFFAWSAIVLLFPGHGVPADHLLRFPFLKFLNIILSSRLLAPK